MNKPQYELVPLRAAVMQCRTNIVTFQGIISKEETKIDELQVYIKQWEDYNRGENEYTDKSDTQSQNNHSTRG